MLFALVVCTSRKIPEDRRNEMAQGVHQAVKSTKLGAGKGRISHVKKHTVHRRHNGVNILMKSQMNLKNQKNPSQVFSIRTLVLYVDVAIKSYAISP